MAYGTTTDAQAYWTARGYDGTPTDAGLEIASAFVDGLGWRMAASGVPVSRFPGKPASAAQEREWPRTGAADFYGNDLPDDTVPGAIERATYEAAWHESQNPGTLNLAIRSDERVVREKFGDIEFQYAESGTAGGGIAPTAPVIPAVLTILAPVLSGGSNPYGITGVVA
ncbi:DnaT-like ssDNA-binding protein [Tranquillimonas rosea]|uniref:DnaT-like ssDNA-binding protein n=1 Tax=Tranquillimonas rosea TaxID=641238 RepID=UPI003BA86903